jgi:hypothetical protein
MSHRKTESLFVDPAGSHRFLFFDIYRMFRHLAKKKASAAPVEFAARSRMML